MVPVLSGQVAWQLKAINLVMRMLLSDLAPQALCALAVWVLTNLSCDGGRKAIT